MAILSTVTLLDDLKQLGLGDPLFMEELHHLGGTMNGFRNHAANKTFFQRDGCNQLLHDRLEYIRTRCNHGALRSGTAMKDLVDEAKRAVPCKGYTNCRKHASDPGCAKLK